MNIVYGCVKLRAIEEKDFDITFDMINSPEIESTSGAFNYPYSSSQHRKWLTDFKNTDRFLRFMIELENGHTIGMNGLSNIDWKNRVAEISLKVSPSAKGRMPGDTFDAQVGLLRFAFLEMGMNRIEGFTYTDNAFSLKIAKKCGFKEEGILKQRVYRNGKFCDQKAIAILKNDFIELFCGDDCF